MSEPVDAMAAARMRWSSVDVLLRVRARLQTASNEVLAMKVIARSEGMPDEVIEWINNPYTNSAIPECVTASSEMQKLSEETGAPRIINALAAVRSRWPSVDGLMRAVSRDGAAADEWVSAQVEARAQGMPYEVIEWILGSHDDIPASVSKMSELVEMAKAKGEGRGTGTTQGGG